MIEVTCNACGKDFEIREDSICSVSPGEITVRYYSCPECGCKYQILTSDEEMRKLIVERQQLVQKIAIGRAHKFRSSVMQRYIWEEQKLAYRLKKKRKALKDIGEKILQESDGK